ncbi:hypothetical protein [Chelativorans sp.]|uniref:hypothetical protein n=1 Tax=Chelativorans sp. TaxID=2203393 RepID=UPI0028114CAC|nr:hypothetical protein [Chelativorans sp.]
MPDVGGRAGAAAEDEMAKVTRDNLFKPTLSRTETKSRTTDEVSRAITSAEVAQRERKTARLKAMRLAKEAEEREKGGGEPPKKLARAKRKKA